MDTRKNRVFTVEVNSKDSLRNVHLGESEKQGVFIEGTIGHLIEARFEEDVILQIIGDKGTIRIDLQRSEIQPQKEVRE